MMDPAREPGTDTLSVGINKWTGRKDRFSIFQTLLSPDWTVGEQHGQRRGDESGCGPGIQGQDEAQKI